jgi:uncharacterized membrane protein YkvI
VYYAPTDNIYKQWLTIPAMAGLFVVICLICVTLTMRQFAAVEFVKRSVLSVQNTAWIGCRNEKQIKTVKI